jgi:hypothetical protein
VVIESPYPIPWKKTKALISFYGSNAVLVPVDDWDF